MGKGKELNLEYKKLINIVKEINKNTIDNKTRTKEEKISTDKLLRERFNISRKDFSFTIKNTDIKYNTSTHLYDIGNNKSETKASLDKNKELKDKPKISYKSNTLVKNDKINLEVEEILNLKKELVDLLNVKEDLIDMLKHHKDNTKTIKTAELNINNIPEELQKKIVTKSIKIYDPIYKQFNKLCKKYLGIKKQDMISLCILEFTNKYIN